MTTTRPRQLELPVMVDVNGKAAAGPIERGKVIAGSGSVSSEFHKPATAGDQSIYKAISDNYFSPSEKQA